MIVLFCDEAVIDAGEFAIDAEYLCWFHTRVGGGLGIEDPAVGVGYETVALLEGLGRCIVGWEPDEDVIACDGEIEDYVAVGVLVAPGNVAVEGWVS
jgi:hypothetical protein